MNGTMAEMDEWYNGWKLQSLNGTIIVFFSTEDAQHLEALA